MDFPVESYSFLPGSRAILDLSYRSRLRNSNYSMVSNLYLLYLWSCLSRLAVLSSTFLPQSSAKRLFHDTSGGTFRIIIPYQESIIASFKDIWQSKLSQNVDRR